MNIKIKNKDKAKKRISCKLKLNKFEIYLFMLQTSLVIKNHFPDFLDLLSNVSDYRTRPQYKVEDLLMAVICMFLFKRGSRNAMDNTMVKGVFATNLSQIFKCDLPDLDTSNRLLQILDPNELEEIKQKIIEKIIRKKLLNKFRIFNHHYLVAVDGTGIQSFSKEPYPGCPHKTSKNGVTIWTAYVLEAKIVCTNGFSFSIATEWVRNPTDKEYEKQDCELKAFIRLAEKIKKSNPRLPIIIAADGLYPNNTAFNICESNKWLFIFTFKNGNLKTVWKEINLLKDNNKAENETTYETGPKFSQTDSYTFLNDLEYKQHNVNFIELTSIKQHVEDKENEEKYFAHITNIKIDNENFSQISEAGRLRWKIENEGFKNQKEEYNLTHKYSRKSFNAQQNYYQCLQIAHIINQLAHKTEKVNNMITGNDTVKSFLEAAIALLMWNEIDVSLNEKCNFRY